MKLWLGIKAACLITVSVFACILLADLHKLAGKADLTLGKADTALDGVSGLSKQGATAFSNLADTTLALKGTISVVNGGLGAETALLQASTKQLGKTEYAFRSLIDHTDKSLNQPVAGLLPQLTSTLGTGNDVLLAAKHAVETANEDLTQAQPGILSFNAAMDNTNQLAQNLVNSAKQTTLITTNLAVTTGNFRDVSQKFRDDYMKPVNRIWATFKGGLDLAYKIHSF